MYPRLSLVLMCTNFRDRVLNLLERIASNLDLGQAQKTRIIHVSRKWIAALDKLDGYWAKIQLLPAIF